MLNVYLSCDCRTIERLIEQEQNLTEFAEKIATEEFHELIILGDFNGDPNKDRFFKEFKCFIELGSLDMDRLPYDSYRYISRNQSCNISWLDHVLKSINNILESLYNGIIKQSLLLEYYFGVNKIATIY